MVVFSLEADGKGSGLHINIILAMVTLIRVSLIVFVKFLKWYIMYDRKLNHFQNNSGIGLNTGNGMYVTKPHYRAEVYSKLIYDDLVRFRQKGKWIIPQEIMEGPQEFKIAFVKAFFEDEGNYGFRNYKLRVIEFTNTNLEGLIQLQKLLLDLKIPSKIQLRPKTKRHKLRIYGDQNIKRFIEIINPLKPLLPMRGSASRKSRRL